MFPRILARFLIPLGGRLWKPIDRVGGAPYDRNQARRGGEPRGRVWPAMRSYEEEPGASARCRTTSGTSLASVPGLGVGGDPDRQLGGRGVGRGHIRSKLAASFVLLLGVSLISWLDARELFGSAVAAGSTASVGVVASGGELLDGWIDFNGNGSWADPGEQIFRNQLLLQGANRLTFRVPIDAAKGGMWARFRLHSRRRSEIGRGLSFEGLAPNEEVEDHRLGIVVPFFRDVRPGLYLGGSVDVEPDHQPSVAGNGDDLAGSDDGDGVVFGSAVEAGNTASVEVTASGGGLLNAWIDFDGNGAWEDAGEQIFKNQILFQDTNRLTFRVPIEAAGGGTWARFRLHRRRPSETAGSFSLEGLAPDGKVEDYRLDIVVPFFHDGFETGDVSAWSKSPPRVYRN